MKRYFFMILWILVFSPAFAAGLKSEEDDLDKPVTHLMAPPLATENFSLEHLSGKWAIGATYSPQGGYEFLARCWMDERAAFDLIAGGIYSPGPAPTPNSYTNTNWKYTLGVGIRQNIARPVEDVFVQWLVQLSFSQYYYQQINNMETPAETSTNQGQTLNLYLGPGFEAFLPFWKNLSIEASIGINLSSVWSEQSVTNDIFQITPNSSNTSTWAWSAGVGNNNTSFSIFSAAVHFYL